MQVFIIIMIKEGDLMNSFKALWNDIRYSFIDLFDDFHHFLNRWFDDRFLGIVGIALIAITVVVLFTNFTTKQ